MATVTPTTMRKLLNDPEQIVKDSLAGLAAVTYDFLAEPRRRQRPIAEAVTHPEPADLAATVK